MHRDLNGFVTSLVKVSPQDWEDKVPFAQFVLRTLPREVLGGRSHYVIVTGLEPVLPDILKTMSAPIGVSVSEYSEQLLESLREIYHSVSARRLDAADKASEG